LRAEDGDADDLNHSEELNLDSDRFSTDRIAPLPAMLLTASRAIRTNETWRTTVASPRRHDSAFVMPRARCTGAEADEVW